MLVPLQTFQKISLTHSKTSTILENPCPVPHLCPKKNTCINYPPYSHSYRWPGLCQHVWGRGHLEGGVPRPLPADPLPGQLHCGSKAVLYCYFLQVTFIDQGFTYSTNKHHRSGLYLQHKQTFIDQGFTYSTNKHHRSGLYLQHKQTFIDQGFTYSTNKPPYYANIWD